MSSSLVEYPTKRDRWRDETVVRRRDGLLHYGGLTPSLTELLDVRAHRYAGREAVVEIGGPRLTYRELWTSASKVAGGLQDRGIGFGDRVAIRFPNGVQWVQAFLGALLSGAVPVPVHYGSGAADIAHVLADSQVDFILDGELPRGRPFIDDGACLSELALLCYTRGIGGPPKGVELSNENILSAIESVIRAEQLPCDGVRNLVLLPLSHASGCVDQLLPTLAVGGTVVIAPELGPDRLRHAIETERIDVLTATPGDYRNAVAHRGFTNVEADVRRICCAGGVLTADQAAVLHEAFPVATQWSWWGATETSGVALTMPGEYAESHPESIGIAFGGTELALLGPDAEEGCGELLCRGPNVMRGYWNNPEATARNLTENWFHTGDFVEIDDDGFVRMVAADLPSAQQPRAQAR